ncbi:unnamed protein product [Schistosoma rodhaini]|uniref:Uncharacterized protein n=1 Tax=Schistosoma rodhaini TaxID=6188 RepID=A0AA85GEI2_9TREM|nr:unnamed protein product [Schistosoma rodhaini]CAH8645483.1 unnamed protein product [Schistosoma rodhaini]
MGKQKLVTSIMMACCLKSSVPSPLNLLTNYTCVYFQLKSQPVLYLTDYTDCSPSHPMTTTLSLSEPISTSHVSIMITMEAQLLSHHSTEYVCDIETVYCKLKRKTSIKGFTSPSAL